MYAMNVFCIKAFTLTWCSQRINEWANVFCCYKSYVYTFENRNRIQFVWTWFLNRLVFHHFDLPTSSFSIFPIDNNQAEACACSFPSINPIIVAQRKREEKKPQMKIVVRMPSKTIILCDFIEWNDTNKIGVKNTIECILRCIRMKPF